MRIFDVFTTAADGLTDKLKGAPTSLELKSRFKAAVFAGHIDRARRALEGGIMPDADLGWDSRHSDLNTFAMMHATKEGDRKMIDLLLEYGADIDKSTGSIGGYNPLGSAAVAGDARMVAFLLSRGADAEKAVETYRYSNGLLPYLEKEGLTDVHALLKEALDAKREEKEKWEMNSVVPPQVVDSGDSEPVTAPKTATFRKTKVAVKP